MSQASYATFLFLNVQKCPTPISKGYFSLIINMTVLNTVRHLINQPSPRNARIFGLRKAKIDWFLHSRSSKYYQMIFLYMFFRKPRYVNAHLWIVIDIRVSLVKNQVSPYDMGHISDILINQMIKCEKKQVVFLAYCYRITFLFHKKNRLEKRKIRYLLTQRELNYSKGMNY